MRRTSPILTAATVAALATAASGSELLWSNPYNGNSVTEPSMQVLNVDPATDAEVADDFDVNGSVERLIVHGYDCSSCGAPPVAGVNVRFRAWTPDGPGALQAEHFLAAGDPGFVYDAGGPAVLDITLPAPFAASGQHFVSVQMVFGEWGWWTWWFSAMNNPQGSAIWYRDETGAAWGPHVDFLGNVSNHDVAFDLYGTPADDGDTELVNGCGAWSVEPSPIPPGTESATLHDVLVLAPNDAWAVGRFTAQVLGGLDQFTLTLHWDGTVIRPALAMHWDGSGFEVFEAPFFDQYDETLASVAAAASDDVWAVGTRSQPIAEAVVYHYDGSGWSQVTIPDPPLQRSGLSEVLVIAPEDVWATGTSWDPFPGDAVPWFLHWDGSAWTAVPSPAGGSSLAAVAPDDIYSWGLGGLAHWNGATWTAEPPLAGVPGAGFGALAKIGPCALWAVGAQSVAGSQMPLTAAITPAETPPDPIAGDANGDGLINVDDLVTVMTAWGPCANPGACSADLDGNGVIDVNDLVLVILNWS